MTHRERIEKAWAFQEPDRVPIEIRISPEWRTRPVAERLMSLIEGLSDATPALRVGGLVAWRELRSAVAAATRPFQLDKSEDPIDAVMCAYVARYRHHRPDDVTVYGDFETGYIVTPTLPLDRKPTPRAERERTAKKVGFRNTGTLGDSADVVL